MSYEFHVGDYVETWDGWIGYVDYWKIYWSEVCHEPALLLRGIAKKDGKELPMDFNFVCSDIPRHFNRIGKYTFGHFTKEEKKKIEALTINKTMYQYTGDGTSNTGADYTAVYDNTKFQDKMIDKINELVDVVNKLMDKENNV